MKTIEIGLLSAVITAAWKLIEAGAAYKNEAFSLRQLLARKVPINFHGKYRWQHLPMSFLNNWAASWEDMFIFPVINALVIPFLWPMTGWQWKYPTCFIIGLAASTIFHRAWWGHDEHLGHIFAGWGSGRRNRFYKDLTSAGYLHFWFMAIQVAIMLAYAFTPMPEARVFWAGILLMIFVAVQNVQAVMIQKGFWPKLFFIGAVQIVAIWSITIIKML